MQTELPTHRYTQIQNEFAKGYKKACPHPTQGTRHSSAMVTGYNRKSVIVHSKPVWVSFENTDFECRAHYM